MQIIFLGTSAGSPTRARNVTSILLRLDGAGEVWMFDCGDGTQQQLMRAPVRPSRVSKVFITHMHGDHIYGLPGILATFSMRSQTKPIEVYGPESLGSLLGIISKESFGEFEGAYGFHPVIDEGIVFENDEYLVKTAPLRHSIPAMGFRVEEKRHRSQFLAQKAIEAGIPQGPLFGELQGGNDITLPNGQRFLAKDFVKKASRTRAIAYCSDTTICNNSIELASGADILIHESTFSNKEQKLAKSLLHSTSEMAAQVAKEAGVRHLILTHFSARFGSIDDENFQCLIEEAKSIFTDTHYANDFDVFQLDTQGALTRFSGKASKKLPSHPTCV